MLAPRPGGAALSHGDDVSHGDDSMVRRGAAAPLDDATDDAGAARTAWLLRELAVVRRRAGALEALTDVAEARGQLAVWRAALGPLLARLAAADLDVETHARAAGRDVESDALFDAVRSVTLSQDAELDDDYDGPLDDECEPLDPDLAASLAAVLEGAEPDARVLQFCAGEAASRLEPFAAALRGRVARVRSDVDRVERALKHRERLVADLVDEADETRRRCDDAALRAQRAQERARAAAADINPPSVESRPLGGLAPRPPKKPRTPRPRPPPRFAAPRNPAAPRSHRAQKSPRLHRSQSSPAPPSPDSSSSSFVSPRATPRRRGLRKITAAALHVSRDDAWPQAFRGRLDARLFCAQWNKTFPSHALTQAEADAVVPVFDRQGDGTVDGQEFLQAFFRRSVQLRRSALKRQSAEMHDFQRKAAHRAEASGERHRANNDVAAYFSHADLVAVQKRLTKASITYVDQAFRAVGQAGLRGFASTAMEPWHLREQVKRAFGVHLAPRGLGALVDAFGSRGTVNGPEFVQYFLKLGAEALNERRSARVRDLAALDEFHEAAAKVSMEKRCDYMPRPQTPRRSVDAAQPLQIDWGDDED
ncbi:hypothetical protein M885DRAFT_517441 [Pelagophyceae sp. CCMP2097]|nr:hypothetical protein M885DRAFT_517441 [Pelagophyceae sp. CCMP2097]